MQAPADDDRRRVGTCRLCREAVHSDEPTHDAENDPIWRRHLRCVTEMVARALRSMNDELDQDLDAGNPTRTNDIGAVRLRLVAEENRDDP